MEGSRRMMSIIFVRVVGLFFWSLATLFFLHVPEYYSQKPARSITILAWPNIIDSSQFSLFEKKYGIKVYLTYFENYEELFVKLKGSGASGYDLIMTSDYMAEQLIHAQLLDPIEKNKCQFWSRLRLSMLGLYCDLDNHYTIPYALSLYGLGIDLTYFGGKINDPSWGLLFNTNHVGMPDDAREVILIAAHYLFGSIDDLDDEKLEQVKKMLRAQKKRVEMYSDLRTDYLLFSKTAPVVAAMHPDLAHAIQSTSHIRFIVPKEGAFGVLDSFAFPRGASNKEVCYQFLNFLYEHTVMSYYAARYQAISALNDVDLPTIELDSDIQELIKNIHFFRNVVPAKKLTDCWISIKS